MRSHTPPSPAALPKDCAPARAGRATLAYVIDALIVSGISISAYLLRPSLLLALTTMIELAVVMTFTRAATGHTPGSLITRTRARHAQHGGAPGLRAQSVHTLIMALLHLTAIGPLLTHLLAKHGQTLPDRIAGIIITEPSPANPAAQKIQQDAYGRQTLASADHSPTWSAPTPIARDPLPQAFPPPPSPLPTPHPVAVAEETPAAPPSLPQPPAPQHHEYWVVFDSGEHARITDTLLIGRSPTAQSPHDSLLGVPDPSRSLSRTHLRIVRSRIGLWIDDLGSANGTYIQRPDGTEISVTPGSPEEATVGCIVHLGERFFHITSPTDPAP